MHKMKEKLKQFYLSIKTTIFIEKHPVDRQLSLKSDLNTDI